LRVGAIEKNPECVDNHCVRIQRVTKEQRERRARQLAIGIVAVSLLVAVVQAFVPDMVNFWVTVAWPVGAAAVTWVACSRHSGRFRHAWILIAAGMTVNAIGDVIFDVYDILGDVPSVSWADPFYLATYPCILIGMGWWITIRGRSSVGEIFIDASAVATVAGLVIWQAFVVAPEVLVSGTFVERFVYASYPMADVLLVAALMGALFSSARRQFDMLLMVGFAVALLIADSLYSAVQLVSDPRVIEDASNGFYYVAYGLIAGAALMQPMIPREDDGVPADSRPISYFRLTVLGIALCGAPVFAVGSVVLGYAINAPISIGATVIVSAMVMVRFAGMVRRLEREQRRLGDAEARLVYQASHDALTGLPNRTMLTERLVREIRAARVDGSCLALMFIDLDGFKGINDTLGHQTGDMLLAAVASRIRAALRPTDLVARIGGDEFLVVAPRLGKESFATIIADRIMESIGQPLPVGENILQTASSIGIAMMRHGDDAEQLIAHADLALYQAKAFGGTQVRVFDPTMRESADRRARIASGLRESLERGTLRVVYQPRVRLAGSRVTSVEALVRWPDHPDVGIPEMIEVAEATNQIERLGRFVLDRACGDIAAVNLHLDTPIGVAVNVSMRQLLRQDLAREVRGVLDHHGLPPQLLTLELTETLLADEPALAVVILNELRAMGVRIEIDDFGKGYSSLSRLSALPIDGLKIDRRFITGLGIDPTAKPMVEAIIGLARAVNVETTAEGIENDDQRIILRDLGCRFGQGFHLGRPMPLTELAAMLGEHEALLA
jgi:diguanylate cyclase (GGDEF)-like protein